MAGTTSTRDDRLRTYAGGRFSLELDDHQPMGWVTSIDGGHLKSQPVSSMAGVDSFVAKYAGRATFDDITVTLGTAMSPQLWKWVEASINRKPERRNGAIVGYDYNLCERSRRTFSNALISEIAFPALDAASKNAHTVSLKLAPESIEFGKPDGNKRVAAYGKDEVSKQKMWLSNNFSFSLDRFKGDESLFNIKVDGFSIKQTIIPNPVGSEMWARKEAGRLELPNIVVHIPENLSRGWADWYKTSVIEGNRLKQYTTGAIRFFGQPQKRDELMRFELSGVSLLSLEFDKMEASKEGISMVKATLQVEGLDMKTGDGTVGKAE